MVTTKDQFVQLRSGELAQLAGQIEKIELRARLMNYEHTSNHQEWRDELNARRAQIESKLAEIDRAPADGWQDLGNEVDQELVELSEVAKSAIQQRTAGR
jgi:hypothetical protein